MNCLAATQQPQAPRHIRQLCFYGRDGGGGDGRGELLVALHPIHIFFSSGFVLFDVRQPGRPSELVLLEPGPKDGGGGSVVTTEAGAKLPAFEFVTMDVNGNRTAPLHNETWKVGSLVDFVCCLVELPVDWLVPFQKT